MKALLFLAFTVSALAEPINEWDFDPAMWRIEDGLITGGSTTDKIKGNDFISTKQSFQNFDLTLKIKCSGDPKTGLINSGIQIRSVRDGNGKAMSGYQIDCGAGWFGKIYDEHRRNKVIYTPNPEQQAALDKAVDVFGWNEYRILAEGPRIQAWINGVHCIDYTEQDPNIALDGHIAPQVHGGGVCQVQVKDVSIKELPATPNAPTWQSVGNQKSKIINHKSKRDTSYNDIKSTALTAQEQLKKFHVAPGYEIELVAQETAGIGKFVSVTFDQRGRLWTQTAFEYPVDANENPAVAEALYAGKGKDKVLVYAREALNAPLPKEGLQSPTIFADGLAIPLGVLPWGNGDSAYILHGHDIKLFKDTDGDGRSDKSDVILTGFGVQDSHLFPHQFTRAPGGWIWMAQGLFNNSKVKRPGDKAEVDYPKCGMARMRPDGSEFEVTSVGPNNIWGLAITRDGEAFIQEANDYGYPVMPFQEYAYYPGGMEALKKSYQPDFPPQTELRMGGTGLSGLALIEGQATMQMAVANPITSKIHTLAMHREAKGTPSGWRLEQLPDLITCDDPFFRPVGLTNGPDGCIYIVDWYNKIISHNEVPRAHPDRDKTRGRIWRVKPKAVNEVPDFTALPTPELITMLTQTPTARAHLAWQTLQDRNALPADHWAHSEYQSTSPAAQIRQYSQSGQLGQMLTFAQPSLPGPTTQSSRGNKQIPTGPAYAREYERFLVRMFLERQPDAAAKFLDSEAATKLPIEARVLASLALEPKASASRVAKLLPQLDRAPNDEELLRLAQFPDEPGCGDALKAMLAKPTVAGQLLTHKAKLDPAKIAPLLNDAARTLLASFDPLAVQLIGGFQLTALEPELVKAAPTVATLTALRELRSEASDLFASLLKSDDKALANVALSALAMSRNPKAPAQLIGLYATLTAAQQRAALSELSATKAGAAAIVAAIKAKQVPATDLDGPAAERLSLALGSDPELAALMSSLGHVFREVMIFNGRDDAWLDSKITLEGPFTVETWVKLAPGIHNNDSLLGSPGELDLNFFQSKFRCYGGSTLHDVAVSKKPITPDLWTHIAVTRDQAGNVKLYQNGELDALGTKPMPQTIKDCRIGWSGPDKGTEGMMAEYRVWKVERSAAEICANFDRVLPDQISLIRPIGPISSKKSVRLAKTTDAPPLLTAEQATALDTKFTHYTALAAKTGDPAKGKVLSALCMACHQVGSAGGQIGPNLSGVGAMGVEAILRNILTPNAAMEPGYRIFRVEMNSGDIVDAFFVSEDKEAFIVRQPGLADRRIAKPDVRRTSYIRRSLMPEGLLNALSDEQVTDLMSYLVGLKG